MQTSILKPAYIKDLQNRLLGLLPVLTQYIWGAYIFIEFPCGSDAACLQTTVRRNSEAENSCCFRFQLNFCFVMVLFFQSHIFLLQNCSSLTPVILYLSDCTQEFVWDEHSESPLRRHYYTLGNQEQGQKRRHKAKETKDGLANPQC